jgi:hypothetical protein
MARQLVYVRSEDVNANACHARCNRGFYVVLGSEPRGADWKAMVYCQFTRVLIRELTAREWGANPFVHCTGEVH